MFITEVNQTTQCGIITGPRSFKWHNLVNQYMVYLNDNFRQYSQDNAESAYLKIIRLSIKYSLPTAV